MATLDLIAALQAIIASAPEEEPEAEEYDDTESAYNNGLDVAAWEAAEIARAAMKAAADPFPGIAEEMLFALRRIRHCASAGPESCVDRIEAIDKMADDAIKAAESPLPSDVAMIRRAIYHLKVARHLLKAAGAERTLDRVRLALTSAGGAERHAIGKESRS